ncbi:ketimine reductase mu-crystallin-like isoform X2 [Penaeus japonicus]|uniref:ketimine reductase mu-crystallin-like isoform X2 n=1 Tax=Penaeus japonicus TaxID=27405 RepID=UPI001C712D7F|nr:ketimine reductase mu-crystallin-like isoform X2 [Penaeus japonicus]
MASPVWIKPVYSHTAPAMTERESTPLAPGVAIRSTYGWVSWVSDEDVRRVLTWELVLGAVRRALEGVSRGPSHPLGAVQPLRVNVPAAGRGNMLVMSGFVKEDAALSTKVLQAFPSSHHSYILLFDPAEGHLQAMVEGDAITEMRTAASSALATMELHPVLNGEAHSEIVAVLGAGRQALAHAQVLAHCYKGAKIRIWARRPEAAEALVQQLQSEGILAESSTTVQEAVSDADIINICTGAATSILKGEWIKLGAHVNSIGALRPDCQEMDEALVKSAIVYTDSREQALARAGDIIKTGVEIAAEIGEVFLGQHVPPKNSTTIFKSLGLGVQDSVCARLVYDRLLAEKE